MPNQIHDLTHAGDVVIVGGGLAGLFCALKLAPRPVTVISAAPLGEGASTAWAQGGIAAAVAEGDSAEAHAADTVAAGAGLDAAKGGGDQASSSTPGGSQQSDNASSNTSLTDKVSQFASNAVDQAKNTVTGFIDANLGKGIGKHFMVPYNEKLSTAKDQAQQAGRNVVSRAGDALENAGQTLKQKSAS